MSLSATLGWVDLQKNKLGFLMVDIGLCIFLTIASVSLVATSYFYREKRRSDLEQVRKEIDERYEEGVRGRKGCVIKQKEDNIEEEEASEVTQ